MTHQRDRARGGKARPDPARRELGPDAEDAPDFTGPEADTDEMVLPEGEDPARRRAAAALPAGRSLRPGERRPAQAAPGPTPVPSTRTAQLRDRPSAIFVIVSIATFVLILLNAVLFGKGGALSPTRTPTPAATLSASPSAASPSAGGSPSGAASPGGGPPSPAPGSPAASPIGGAATSPPASPGLLPSPS